MPPERRRRRKKSKQVEAVGVAHILATFNNTIITLTDTNGNVISWATPGKMSIKGSRKSTPFAGQLAAEKAAQEARSMGLDRGWGANRRSARYRMPGWRFLRSAMSRPFRTMVAGRPSAAGSKRR